MRGENHFAASRRSRTPSCPTKLHDAKIVCRAVSVDPFPTQGRIIISRPPHRRHSHARQRASQSATARVLRLKPPSDIHGMRKQRHEAISQAAWHGGIQHDADIIQGSSSGFVVTRRRESSPHWSCRLILQPIRIPASMLVNKPPLPTALVDTDAAKRRSRLQKPGRRHGRKSDCGNKDTAGSDDREKFSTDRDGRRRQRRVTPVMLGATAARLPPWRRGPPRGTAQRKPWSRRPQGYQSRRSYESGSSRLCQHHVPADHLTPEAAIAALHFIDRQLGARIRPGREPLYETAVEEGNQQARHQFMTTAARSSRTAFRRSPMRRDSPLRQDFDALGAGRCRHVPARL